MYNMHRKTHYDDNPYKGKKNITNIKRQCPKYFLPNYKDLIQNIDVQRSEIETRARRTEKNINFYTLTAQHMVENIGALQVQNLRGEKRKYFKEMDDFKNSIEEKINQLQQMSDMISGNLKSKPHISLFQPWTNRISAHSSVQNRLDDNIYLLYFFYHIKLQHP